MMHAAGIMPAGGNVLHEKAQGKTPLNSSSSIKEKDGGFSALLAGLSLGEESEKKGAEKLLSLLDSGIEDSGKLKLLMTNADLSLEEILKDVSLSAKKEEALAEIGSLLNHEIPAAFANADYAELLEKMQDLLAEVPEDSLRLDEESLASADAENLLGELPSEWREELKAFFEEQVSFQELTEDFADSGDPLAIIAMLIQAGDEQTPVELIDGDSEAAFVQALEQTAAKLFSLKDPASRPESRSVLNDMSRLFQKAEQERQMPAITERASESSRSESASSRYAELAYLKQAAQKAVATNPGNQGPSLMLESTNSQLARFQHFMSSAGDTQPQQSERTSQEQLIRQFQNLLSRSSFQQLNNGLQQLNIKLHPESLGRLDIQLQQVNGMMTAKLMTSTQSARELLDGQLQSLRNAFQAQNIPVEKIEITQQQTNQLLKDQSQSDAENGSHSPEEDADEHEEAETLDFSEFLEETLESEASMNEEA
ncbi:flagellar hook-length control protein FliK [Salisediminibacterium halotolerans]|uniref:flagellar hook-length control protein FliK n=1 Tax=Salisediminibacterium halotolerans TaxID=517425 RepID=UPI000EAC4595|nr:flagellar hook-length control protein FliK [Salisediminibacterium halotolerans]RLJ74217.1 flagellar hook-length control protein FliK [Actinophytocola xinjiangensis]RPE87690.1 flagellar hook-length control protein FliK [Salisediminibacterium halotolerans]TWG35054.1 flagellar hook-length control protein FliK [Salisediminibacterium halotolerans]GEL06659.1 hypothetical protein SHA02_00750 [Salisediminibacterium halotolerans]